MICMFGRICSCCSARALRTGRRWPAGEQNYEVEWVIPVTLAEAILDQPVLLANPTQVSKSNPDQQSTQVNLQLTSEAPTSLAEINQVKSTKPHKLLSHINLYHCVPLRFCLLPYCLLCSIIVAIDNRSTIIINVTVVIIRIITFQRSTERSTHALHSCHKQNIFLTTCYSFQRKKRKYSTKRAGGCCFRTFCLVFLTGCC